MARSGARVSSERTESWVRLVATASNAPDVAKMPGDEVFAGTVNGTGALVVEVSRAAADSVVARIVALVEEASATKAQRQLLIEKVEATA